LLADPPSVTMSNGNWFNGSWTLRDTTRTKFKKTCRYCRNKTRLLVTAKLNCAPDGDNHPTITDLQPSAMTLSNRTYHTRTPCLNISGPLAWNTPYSFCSSHISTTYRTLHYQNITYCHSYYDVRTVLCVISGTSLWCQSMFTLRLRSIHWCLTKRSSSSAPALD